jgi:hypothetical protein
MCTDYEFSTGADSGQPGATNSAYGRGFGVRRGARRSGWLVLVWWQSGSKPSLLRGSTQPYYFFREQAICRRVEAGTLRRRNFSGGRSKLTFLACPERGGGLRLLATKDGPLRDPGPRRRPMFLPFRHLLRFQLAGVHLLLEGEDPLPVVLHADHDPPLLRRLVMRASGNVQTLDCGP